MIKQLFVKLGKKILAWFGQIRERGEGWYKDRISVEMTRSRLIFWILFVWLLGVVIGVAVGKQVL